MGNQCGCGGNPEEGELKVDVQTRKTQQQQHTKQHAAP